MKTIDITFDLETTSLQPNAAIMSIGAVAWNRNAKLNPFVMSNDHDSNYNEGVETYFSHTVDLVPQFVNGFDFSASTAKWWTDQSKEAKEALVHGYSCHPQDVIRFFKNWIEDTILKTYKADNYRLWCQGTDADMAWFRHFCSVFDTEGIFKLHRCFFRDARTYILESIETIFRHGDFCYLFADGKYSIGDFRYNPQTVYEHLPKMKKCALAAIQKTKGYDVKHSAIFDAAQSSYSAWVLTRCIDAMSDNLPLPLLDFAEDAFDDKTNDAAEDNTQNE